MAGKLFGVGVGPGDPELITIKGVKCMETAEVIAAPCSRDGNSLALSIASKAVDLSNKKILYINFPMKGERAEWEDTHSVAADLIEERLAGGLDVCFLTLGDPTIYSTFTYVADIIKERGYQVEYISGVPSFCAAVAKAGTSLALDKETIIISPSLEQALDSSNGLRNELNATADRTSGDVTKVILKSRTRERQEIEAAINQGKHVIFAKNIGLEGEEIIDPVENFPEDPGYLSLFIVK